MVEHALKRCIGFAAGLLLALLLAWNAFATQAPDPCASPPIVLDEQTKRLPLGLSMDLLEDPGGQLTIEQVSSPTYTARFTPSRAKTPNFGVTSAAIWVRLCLHDNSRLIPYWLLEIDYPPLENIDLYLPQTGGGYQVFSDGLLVPNSTQPYPDKFYLFRLPPGLQVRQAVYLRFASANPLILPLALYAPEVFDLYARSSALLWGAYFGILLGMALLAGGLIFLAFGFQTQNLLLVFLGTLLGGVGFSFTNPVQMAALSATPLEQRGMLAGILPLAGNFGTAFWVALLTAGMSALMGRYAAGNPGSSEAAALSIALAALAWAGLLLTLVTLFVATKLPKTAGAPGGGNNPQTAKETTK